MTKTKQNRVVVKPGYEALARVLDMALEQAQSGKGLERHAEEGQAFVDQDICVLGREKGIGFVLGQARKKLKESGQLSIPAAIHELCGVMNYVGATIILLQEQLDG